MAIVHDEARRHLAALSLELLNMEVPPGPVGGTRTMADMCIHHVEALEKLVRLHELIEAPLEEDEEP